MSGDDPGVLPGHGHPGVPLAGVLDEGVALVQRAAEDLPVLGEDGLDVALGHHRCVEVADEDAGVEGARVILVGHVAGLGLPSHPSPRAALPAGTHSRTLLRKLERLEVTRRKPKRDVKSESSCSTSEVKSSVQFCRCCTVLYVFIINF